MFATDEFRKGAAEKYVLLMVDSPSDKSLLTPEAAKNNPKLVKKFGIEGYPTVVVLDPKGEASRLRHISRHLAHRALHTRRAWRREVAGLRLAGEGRRGA